MALQDLIDQGLITEAGIGDAGTLCGEDCIDTDGGDSGDLSPTWKCGDKYSVDDEIQSVLDVPILVVCDSAENEINLNRRAIWNTWRAAKDVSSDEEDA